ncbi:MAG: ABC transporter [Acidimicrobiia bacterium]|nr:ABC transporter [Acidimicrobiia bacterium]
MTGLLRVVQRNLIVYRRVWRGSLFSSFLQPTMYLLAMGLGIGALVDRTAAALPGDVAFLDFLAPGLLAAACMQTATFESSWPVLGKIRWDRTYDAILATPLGVGDIVRGELAWVALRLTTVAGAFTIVMALFDVPRSWTTLLAIPAAVLTGVAFSAPVLAFAARRSVVSGSNSFNTMFRFVITPLFLFSGVFFPIERLPALLQAAAWGTPLFHGVALVRGLVLGSFESWIWLVHLGYLLVMLAVGYVAALWMFRRRLHA